MTPGRERTRAYRDRKRAEGYRLVKGRFTLEPRKGRQGAEPPHGTKARYELRRDPCRCDECRAAVAAYNRANRAVHRDQYRAYHRAYRARQRESR